MGVLRCFVRGVFCVFIFFLIFLSACHHFDHGTTVVDRRMRGVCMGVDALDIVVGKGMSRVELCYAVLSQEGYARIFVGPDRRVQHIDEVADWLRGIYTGRYFTRWRIQGKAGLFFLKGRKFSIREISDEDLE